MRKNTVLNTVLAVNSFAQNTTKTVRRFTQQIRLPFSQLVFELTCVRDHVIFLISLNPFDHYFMLFRYLYIFFFYFEVILGSNIALHDARNTD